MENIDVGCEKSFFSEKEEVLLMMAQLQSIVPTSCDDQFERFKKIFDAYQEQPQLLGPHIEDIIAPLNDLLVEYVLHRGVVDYKLHHICKIGHLLCKVRGAKQCAKYLPHEVYQLEPCIRFLKTQVRNYMLKNS
jgi:tubulin-specific chaperone D